MESILQIALSNAAVSAVLAALALVVGRLCRRPALTHALWLLVLLKLVTPPIWHVPVPWPRKAPLVTAELPNAPPTVDPIPEFDNEINDSVTATIFTAPAIEDHDIASLELVPSTALPVTGEVSSPTSYMSVASMILGAWLIGTVGYVFIAAVRLRRFRGLLRHACDAPDEIQSKARDTARQLGICFQPEVSMVPGPVSPMLWGVFCRPRVLLPASLWARLSGEQQSTLLAHELAHLRRRDHWTRRLELFVTALFWWNPIVWLAHREISVAEEECCDAWVVWLLPQTARDYAQALLETVDFLSETRPALPPAASGIGHVHHLRRRLAMIMRGSTPRALSRTSIVMLVAVGCLVLPLLPTLAQSQQPDKSEITKEKRAAEEARLAAEYAAKAEAKGRAERLYEAVSEEDAKDAIKLMHAQVEVKKAELVESEIRLKQAMQRMERVEKLAQAGTISSEEVSAAHDQIEIAKVQVHQKKAQLQETMVRTEIATRRAERQGDQPNDPVKKSAKGSVTPPEKRGEDPSLKDYRAAIAQYQDRIKMLEHQLQATAAQQARQADQIQAERARAEATMKEAAKSQDFEKLHQALNAQRAAAEKERLRAETLYQQAFEAQKAAAGAEKTAATKPDQTRLKAVETKLDSLSKEMDAIRKDLKTLIENAKK